ncbi:MAG: 3-dehydroquinate synthase [Candidatus Izemoplasma sp.]
MKIINVPIKDNEYNIYIEDGILEHISEYIDNSIQTVIITDDFIPKIYLNTIRKWLINALVIEIPAREKSKSFDQAYKIINTLTEQNFSRKAQVIALGGGVVGDLAGFVASIYKRGISFIQIPTTLLSQVDSSIGGKVAVNSPLAKNIIGSFYQPKLVLIDPLTLNTLSERELSNGVGEIIKYGVIDDIMLFKTLLNDNIYDNIQDTIYKSLQIKKKYVLADVYDNNIRQILNFGHTIGHAIETISNYDILHGEAIAIGMLKMSKEHNYYKDLLKIVIKHNLPTEFRYNKNDIFEIIKKDKKMESDSILKIILVNKLGNAVVTEIQIEEIKKYL